MVHISASLLAADYARLGEEARRAESAGADSLHFDLMDGHYAPNLAFAPDHLTALRPYTTLPFIAHLELSNPEAVITGFPTFPADTIIVQWNTLAEPLKTISTIRSHNTRVGLGLNPDDELECVARFVGNLDLLLILGVHPGFGGQHLQPGTIEKVRAARVLANALTSPLTIAVDGGVKPENAAALIAAGANCLIMGTALFQSPNMEGTIRGIRETVAGLPRR